LEGVWPDTDTLTGLEGQLHIDLPSLRLASFLLGDTPVPDLPFKAVGSVRSEGDFTRFSAWRVEAGDNTIQFNAEVSSADDFSGSSIDFDLRGTRLGELATLDMLQSLPQQYSAAGRLELGQDSDKIEGLELGLGSIRLKLDGDVDELLSPSSVHFDMQADGPDISLLNDFLGQSLEPEAFSIETRAEGTLEEFRLHGIRARLGSSDLEGQLHIRLGEDPAVSGALDSGHLDLSQWVDLSEETVEEAEPDSPAVASEFVFPDTPLVRLEEQHADLDLQLTTGTLDLGNAVIEDIRLGVVYHERLLLLDPLHLRGVGGATLSGMIRADGTGDVPELVAKLQGRDLKFGLLSADEQALSTYPPADIFLDLTGTGTTYREMASSFDGKLRLYLGKGQVANSGINLFFSDLLTELFTTLNPFAKSSPYTNLDCSVTAADIVSGLVTVEPIIFQTEEITILSSGTIDLNTENIDLSFNTRVRKGIGISAGVVINPLIKLGGKLASPSIELDPAGAVISGGTAVATVGLSLLYKSLADRYFSEKHPCKKAIEEIEIRDAG
jgi:hypothetical protein